MSTSQSAQGRFGDVLVLCGVYLIYNNDTASLVLNTSVATSVKNGWFSCYR